METERIQNQLKALNLFIKNSLENQKNFIRDSTPEEFKAIVECVYNAKRLVESSGEKELLKQYKIIFTYLDKRKTLSLSKTKTLFVNNCSIIEHLVGLSLKAIYYDSLCTVLNG